MTKVISLRKRKNNKIKTPIYKEKSNRKLSGLYEEKFKIIFLLMSVAGILSGAISYRFLDDLQLADIISNNIIVLTSGEFKSIFLHLFKLDIVFVLLNFFVGTSFIGSPVSFLSPLLKCLYIGYFNGYIYNEFELKGVLFCILLLYPCFTITTTSLIFASNENIYMSQYIYDCLNGKNSADNISIRLYLLRYLLLTAINIVCIAVTSLLITFIAPRINIL